MENLHLSPQFRVFFAIQQAVLLQKNTDPHLQIYARTSLPEALKLRGSFTSFVLLLSSFMHLGARSYQEGQLQKLIFVTTDLLEQKIILKITAGGSFWRPDTEAVLNEAAQLPSETRQQLSESIRAVQQDFRGSFELINFPQRGTQVILSFPTQIGSQSHGTS